MMRPNRFIQKILAILLLVLFSQKVGVELYVHNFFHGGRTGEQQSNTTGGQIFNYSCSCVDDFSMPFAEADAYVDEVAVSDHQTFSLTLISSPSPFYRVYHSLRAPPISNL